MQNFERVIVALDLPTPDEAIRTAKQISSIFSYFKIGSKLFTAGGPSLVREVLNYGRCFLDLKYHDIPSVIADAVEQAGTLGVSMLTMHASGGSEMMAESAGRVRAKNLAVRLLGVTVLTSISDLSDVGIATPVNDQVRLLASLAERSGMHGIVCAPSEISDLRATFPPPFLLVAPGIRGSGDVIGDQKRTASAEDAIRAGADYIVIGRPIIAAPDPVAAARSIREKIG
jgi:orotidine-5'-phosphate decarboxylase